MLRHAIKRKDGGARRQARSRRRRTELERALSPETLLKATCDELLDAGEEELSGVGSSLEAELWASSALRILEPLRLLDMRLDLLLLDALRTAAERRGSENALGMLLT